MLHTSNLASNSVSLPALHQPTSLDTAEVRPASCRLLAVHIWFFCLAAIAFSSQLAHGQTIFKGNFGLVDLGSGATGTLTYTFTSGGTIVAPEVVTQGATGVDFTDAGTGTCTTNGTSHVYSAGNSCTVNLVFEPRLAGTRSGALIIKSTSGTTLETFWLQGTGFGPKGIYPPGIYTTVSSTVSFVSVVADGSGNLFLAEPYTFVNGGVSTGPGLFKETPATGGGYTETQITVNGLGSPRGMAVDGAGSLYIADYGNGNVLKLTPNGTGYNQSTLITGLDAPDSVAVDLNGNLYLVLTNGQAIKETLTSTGYTQTTISTTTSLQQPEQIAVDAAGNLYIADTLGAEVLKETPSTGSTYTETKIGSGFTAPWGVAVDPRGVVYVGDRGNLYMESPSSGGYTQSILIPSISTDNISVDARGNVYIVNFGLSNSVTKLDLGDPPALAFAATDVGVTSSDSPKTVTLENVGNANYNLTVPKTGENPTVSTGFVLNSGASGDCPLLQAGDTAPTLAPGASCVLSVSFEPETPGPFTGTLVVTGTNKANGITLPVTIPLSGTANRATPTINWSTPAAITYATALSATQLDASATVGGVPVAGAFVYSPALGTVLGAGSHTLSVTFTPTNATNYTSATGKVTLVVNKARLAVIADSAGRLYGGPNPTFGYTLDGFVNGDTAATATTGTPLVSTTADAKYPWGIYDINVSAGTLVAPNYWFLFVPGSLFIDPAPLTIKATSVTIAYGKPIPIFTYTATGFVNGENSSVLSGKPTETTTATSSSPQGLYPIVITQGTLSALNYAFYFTNGTLTIGPPAAAAPKFLKPAGSYNAGITVTLSDDTAGATIYYTTNGEKPTTSSKKYTGAIEVSQSATIKAVAVAKGHTQSSVASADYKIN